MQYPRRYRCFLACYILCAYYRYCQNENYTIRTILKMRIFIRLFFGIQFLFSGSHLIRCIIRWADEQTIRVRTMITVL